MKSKSKGLASHPQSAPSGNAASQDRQPGRELDALIAERVMGMVVTRDWPCHLDPESGELMAAVDLGRAAEFSDLYDRRGPVFDRSGYPEPVPEYSTDVRDAWRVVEQMRERFGAEFCAAHNGLAESRASFTAPKRSQWILGVTMPHAICLAALEALVPETLGIPTEQGQGERLSEKGGPA